MARAVTGLPPLAVYLHVPWCVQKCPYCDFNSHALSGELPDALWLERIGDDLDEDLAHPDWSVAERPVSSIFFGGGTPSLLDPKTVGAVLEQLDDRLTLAKDVEITLEANPGTVDASRFQGLRAAGVNRLSLGVQSFSDRALKALGRIHGGAEAVQAVAAARAAGFERINLDLMHGLPGQSTAEALADIEQGIDLAGHHLSWYQLTIEPNTAFHSQPPRLPEEDTLADIETLGAARLQAAGYRRYEVSAWARDGQACGHNLNYWTFGDYLGLGPGAHGKLSAAGAAGSGLKVTRSRRTRAPRDWLQHRIGPRSITAAVEPAVLPEEFMLNALRLIDGVDEKLFQAHTGLALDTVAGPLAALRQEGLLREDRLATTALGLRFLDRVVARFLDS
ncbi:MAG: radical SAM family heme chaperone HemW [Gammaproteobacteria bacterium]|nr:radical SAM family heme chaperone HemW [Gammaproteobacteria bacterium]